MTSNNSENPFSSFKSAALFAAAILVGFSASAQTTENGPWTVQLLYNNLAPQGNTSALTAPAIANSTLTASSDSQPVVGISYQFADHLVAEVGVGTAYTSKLAGSGAIQGVGNIGSAQILPLTVFGQYHFFEETAAFRPFVGVGITYAMFQNETGSGQMTALTNPGGPPTTFTIDNAWGFTPQIGLTYAIDKKWFAIVTVSKFYLKTTAHLSSGQTTDAALNPVASAIGIGYRF